MREHKGSTENTLIYRPPLHPVSSGPIRTAGLGLPLTTCRGGSRGHGGHAPDGHQILRGDKCQGASRGEDNHPTENVAHPQHDKQRTPGYFPRGCDGSRRPSRVPGCHNIVVYSCVIAEKLRGQVQSEETKAKRAESMRRAWEKRRAAKPQALEGD